MKQTSGRKGMGLNREKTSVVMSLIKGKWVYRRLNELIYVVDSEGEDVFLKHPWLWLAETVRDSKVRVDEIQNPVDDGFNPADVMVEWKKLIGIEIQATKDGQVHPKFIFDKDWAEEKFVGVISVKGVEVAHNTRMKYMGDVTHMTAEQLRKEWTKAQLGKKAACLLYPEADDVALKLSYAVVIEDPAPLVAFVENMYESEYGLEEVDAWPNETCALDKEHNFYFYNRDIMLY
ncbi:hypothetical protein [Moorena sp. SIO3H5]|uniref:hypothetical protein n=1 Tax=Moorena sp. SIO3H5 TaxID=2607834 RepID=UPI0013BBE89C|nr:hypothetical protein [Moorena sp. SIO3H5]NEO74208.1 hypothetical protein [Moorena sp. SIO3H5]